MTTPVPEKPSIPEMRPTPPVAPTPAVARTPALAPMPEMSAIPDANKKAVHIAIHAKWSKFSEHDMTALKNKDDLVAQVVSKYGIDKAIVQLPQGLRLIRGHAHDVHAQCDVLVGLEVRRQAGLGRHDDDRLEGTSVAVIAKAEDGHENWIGGTTKAGTIAKFTREPLFELI